MNHIQSIGNNGLTSFTCPWLFSLDSRAVRPKLTLATVKQQRASWEKKSQRCMLNIYTLVFRILLKRVFTLQLYQNVFFLVCSCFYPLRLITKAHTQILEGNIKVAGEESK